MLKRLIQVSSLTGMLALTAILPAAAGVHGWNRAGDEDAAAPAGSFKSEMAIPMRAHGFDRHSHDFHFRHHARMEGRRDRHFD